jgi:CHAD domain-containing protein
MEIEAKLSVPSRDVLSRLEGVAEIAGYPVRPGAAAEIVDTYLDTAGRDILAAGYFCRRRVEGDHILVTVKQLRPAEEGVHRRQEYEVELPREGLPSHWPEGLARSAVLEWTRGGDLLEMFTLRQTRIARIVGTAEHPVAELSLDEVRFAGGALDGSRGGAKDGARTGAQGGARPETVYHEVEVELKRAGTENDLAAIARALREEWGLKPESRSKFERALALADAPAPADGSALSGESAGAGPAAAPETAATATPEPVAPEPQPEIELAATPAAAPEPLATTPDESAPELAVPSTAEPEPVPKRRRKAARRQRFLGDGLEILEKPGLKADDTMAEAANKTLLFHLQRMMLHEPGTREGKDEEELHDMRVATRRMRAALRVFEDHIDMRAYKPFLKVLRQTGRELGTVRDLDVFRIKTQSYLDSLPEAERSGLDPLLEAWERERERARGELIDFLDSSRYQTFKEKFEHFLRTPGAGAGPITRADGEPVPTRVGDILPGVLFERLAEVKAFDEPISSSEAPLLRFHQLRITSKGLRYALEFFQEVLGSDSKLLIDRVKLVQDHLGDLQDAVVTCDVLLGFLGSGTWGPPRQDRKDPRQLLPVNAPGVAAYLAVKQNEIHKLMNTFGPVWNQIRGSAFSRPLSALVADL